MKQFQLWNYFRSSASFRVRIAMHYKGLDFDYKPVHLVRGGGEQHSADYRKLNPLGEVPCLIDTKNDKALSQSVAIFDYLDAMYVEPRLFPEDPYDRAQVLRICEALNSGIQPLQNLKVLKYLEDQLGLNADQRKAWTQHWIKQGLANLEQLLQSTAGSYCYGGEITAADMFLVPQIFTSKRFDVNVGDYPTINRIGELCLKHPAFDKAIPQNQPDFEK